ncbi:MAG: TorF family putative porin [Thiotrichaceae bacterium]
MNTQIKLILSATVVAATLGSSAAFAGASANVGATTNYIFRGLEAAAGRGAVSGGVDYEMNNGFSVGTWASTTDASADGTGYEVDLYGSYGGKISEAVGYSVGATSYQYPGTKGLGNSSHLEEINLGLSFGIVEATAAIGVGSNNKDYDYFSLSAGKEFNGIALGGTIGKGDFGGGNDYTHVQLSAGKGDFTLALDKASGDQLNNDAEDVKVSLSYGHSFDY